MRVIKYEHHSSPKHACVCIAGQHGEVGAGRRLPSQKGASEAPFLRERANVGLAEKPGDQSLPALVWALSRPLLLSFILFFNFLAMHVAFRILIPRPRIKPAPPALEARSPNHWTAREAPLFFS